MRARGKEGRGLLIEGKRSNSPFDYANKDNGLPYVKVDKSVYFSIREEGRTILVFSIFNLVFPAFIMPNSIN